MSKIPDDPAPLIFRVGGKLPAAVSQMTLIRIFAEKTLSQCTTFEIGAGAWILAGGTHHSAFSYDITAEYWEDFCEILGIEFVNIDKNTTISSFKQQLRNNEIYYMLNKALR